MDTDAEGELLPESPVPVALDGERIDRAVALLTGLSRGEVARIVASRGVAVDGEVVTTRHRRVSSGQLLAIALPPRVVPDALAGVAPGSITFGVVFEDAHLVVVDKPPGLVVHPGAGHRDDTLAGGLVARYPDLVEAAAAGAGEALRPGIVHRLDKDTSGLLVVARTPDAYRSLVAQLAERSMGRTYRALVAGEVGPDEGVIEAPVGRSSRDPTRMAVTAGGRDARTRYKVLARYVHPLAASLLELQLDTGRTHQIRVHMAAIGHPVLGDARYGGRRREVSCPRPFLHAERLRLTHPATGETLELTSPLPDDLVAVLALFG